ncbi:hypothetical protein PAECIP111893_01424 [Paenibacillus plantiphilus]|uniref:Cupin type-1 domain-containing protein n=1 Tax=Paenibacillus plantiphilus TaxID=2905650 RepID=A0ABM9C2P8_9BACL|nr:hypothetical protein PAECIP111893_01424 [Paenibacillus plantiphilus]
MDYASPSAQFTYDVSNNPFFKKDAQNYINSLSIMQLNTLGNVSLLDIHLSRGNVIEPHIHQNASELVYCISGALVVSLINPFTKELRNFPIQPGQVANVPQGWWHYEIATVDNTHVLAIFDAPIPEFIGGSDLLRLTPASVFAHTYCLNEAQVKATFAPITQTVFIGPPADCNKHQVQSQSAPSHHHAHPTYSNPRHAGQAYAIPTHANQVQANQAYAISAHANQVQANQAFASPAHANQVQANQPYAISAHANQVQANQAFASPAHANQVQANQAFASPAHANQSHANQAFASPAHANQVQANQAYVDPACFRKSFCHQYRQ